MPYIPFPILLDLSPAGGYRLPIEDLRGGLRGAVLLGQSDPAALLEVSFNGGATWRPVIYPYTVEQGVVLRLSRPDGGADLLTLRALASLDEAPLPPLTLPLYQGDIKTVPALGSQEAATYVATLTTPATLSLSVLGAAGETALSLSVETPSGGVLADVALDSDPVTLTQALGAGPVIVRVYTVSMQLGDTTPELTLSAAWS